MIYLHGCRNIVLGHRRYSKFDSSIFDYPANNKDRGCFEPQLADILPDVRALLALTMMMILLLLLLLLLLLILLLLLLLLILLLLFTSVLNVFPMR